MSIPTISSAIPQVSPEGLPYVLSTRPPEGLVDYLTSTECNQEEFDSLRQTTNNWMRRPPISSEQLSHLFEGYMQGRRFARAIEFTKWPEFSKLPNATLRRLLFAAESALEDTHNEKWAKTDALQALFGAFTIEGAKRGDFFLLK